MATITLTSNAKEVGIYLKGLGGKAAKNQKRILERSVKRLQTAAQKYPPPPPSSTYKRTGTLKRGWHPLPYTNQTTGIRNQVPYAHWVQSEAKQAWMHQGRWQTDEDIAKSEIARLQKELDAGILDGV